MPESTCLHIQDRESGPIRVVELSWISVRIGRAAYCEVCLPEGRLPDEACRLTRRGRTWSIVPVRRGKKVLLEGRPLDGPCPLPFDVPFRIGRYCLTLRRDVAAEPDWELYPASGLGGKTQSGEARPLDAPQPAAAVATESEAPAAQPAGEGRTGDDPERWRARWKAAEAHFRARADRLRSGSGGRPTASSSPTPTTEAKRETPRTPIDALARPAPRPAAPRIEPGWNVRISESSARLPRVEPARPVEPARRPEYQPPEAVRPGGFSSFEPTITTDRAARIELASLPSWSAVDAENPRESARVAGLDDAARWSGGSLIESDASAEPPEESAPKSHSEPQPEMLDVVDAAPDAETADPLAEEGSAPVTTTPMDDATIDPAAPADDSQVEGRRSEAETSGPGRGREPSTPGGPSHAPPSSTQRGARRRKPSRDRAVGGRRGESSIRARLTSNDIDQPGDRRTGGRPEPEMEWPTVRDILANQQNRSGPRPAVERRRSARQTVPTVPSEPGQWTVPAWLALPPVGVVVMGVGLLACTLAWRWALDASSAAVATGRLLAADGAGPGRPLPEGIGPPRGRWFDTTAQHLAHWGVYVARATRDEQVATAEAPELLKRALEVSPLNPTARLALAQLEAAEPSQAGPSRVVGLSRDAVSLAWSARRLAAAGKKDAALRLYGRALAAAAAGPSSRTEPPRFAEDDASRDEDATRRYLLPAEDAVRSILVDLAAREGWTFADWAPALPDDPVVLLTAARMLSERGEAGAETLLDRILSHPAPADDEAGASPRMLAARAEALVLRSHWREAAETYRRAIDLADSDLVRRSWWFNLAEIARRLNDEPQRQAAIRAAVDVATTDEIARRARLVLQKPGPETVVARPPRSLGPAKAN
ncbi:MAG: hypothetical protein ACYC61_05805 [Isosphaeraceae bacterium]